jgi:hypothetical protein
VAQYGFSTPHEKYENSVLHEMNQQNREAYFKQEKEAFGRRLGVQGHINALPSNPVVYTAREDGIDYLTLVHLALKIEDEAEKQLNPSAFRQQVQKVAPSVVAPDIQEMADQMANELSTIQQGDDMDALVESVPF